MSLKEKAGHTSYSWTKTFSPSDKTELFADSLERQFKTFPGPNLPQVKISALGTIFSFPRLTKDVNCIPAV